MVSKHCNFASSLIIKNVTCFFFWFCPVVAAADTGGRHNASFAQQAETYLTYTCLIPA
jgi:hypothetical protein